MMTALNPIIQEEVFNTFDRFRIKKEPEQTSEVSKTLSLRFLGGSEVFRTRPKQGASYVKREKRNKWNSS